jgi:hypothetical protein
MFHNTLWKSPIRVQFDGNLRVARWRLGALCEITVDAFKKALDGQSVQDFATPYIRTAHSERRRRCDVVQAIDSKFQRTGTANGIGDDTISDRELVKKRRRAGKELNLVVAWISLTPHSLRAFDRHRAHVDSV